MTNRTLIEIPKDGNYIEILGHRIDGFESFEAFCEYLNKCAVLEETVNRQQATIERLQKGWKADVIETSNIKAEAIKEFAERLKELHQMPLITSTDIDNLVKEMVGEYE